MWHGQKKKRQEITPGFCINQCSLIQSYEIGNTNYFPYYRLLQSLIRMSIKSENQPMKGGETNWANEKAGRTRHVGAKPKRHSERLRLSNESRCSSVFGLKVVPGPDSHLHSVTWARWISLILN